MGGNPTQINGTNYQKILIADAISGDPVSLTNPLPVVQPGIVSDDNSSETPLGADATFLGAGVIVLDPGIVFVNIFSDVASAADGLNIQQSSNGVNWDHDDKYTVPAGKGKNYSINPHSKFAKVDYTNGSTPQTEFRLQTIIKADSLESSHRVKDGILDDDDATLVKAILAADDGFGNMTNVLNDPSGHLRVDLTHQSDVFGNVVIGQRENQIEINFFEDTAALSYNGLLTETLSGGATITDSLGQININSGSSATVSATLISINTIKYRVMHEIYDAFTAAWDTNTANSTQLIGMFDAGDGFAIGYNGTSFGILHREDSSDNFITSFSEDLLDGLPGSKFTLNGIPVALDQTKTNIYRIRYGWLGSAPVIFEIITPDGEWAPFHIIKRPNSANTPVVTTPNVPLRAEVTKTGANSTSLVMRTAAWAGGSSSETEPLNSTLTDDSLAKKVRAVLAAKKPNQDYVNIDATAGGNLKTSLEELESGISVNNNQQLKITPFDSQGNEMPLPLTAFGDLRTAPLKPQFQASFEYTVDNTDLNTKTVAAGGTVTQADAMAVVSTSTTTASMAMLQSKRHARYKSGLGGLLRFTALFTSPVAATEQLIGLTDEMGSSEAFKNGYAIGYIGTVFGFHRFQNDTLITVAQANWDDPLDGTGISGMTLDQTKINIFAIQYQYLGAGAIRLFVESDTTGMFTLVHTVDYANNNVVPSVYNPNFFFHMHVDNKATTSDLIMKSGSYSYFIEGETEFIELHQPQFATGIQEKTTITTEVAILTIRNKSSYVSKTNFIDINIQGISISIEASSANNLANIRIVKNTTLGGTPSYSDINTTNSVIELDTAGTTLTGGQELVGLPLAGKNDKEVRNVVSLKWLLAPGETITISGASANSATIRAGILWRELF